MTPTQDPPQTLPGDFFDKLDQQTGAQPAAAPAATLPGDFFDKLDQQNKDKEKKPPAAPSAWWDPFNREQHPWLSAPTDLVEGAISGAASTAHGINQLVTKGAQYLPGSPQIPNIIPEEYTKAPPSIAGNIGHYGEQAAEFLLPASKIGTAGKAIDAAASVPYLARLTAKAGLEAIPAYGITLAQTGGDTNAAKNSAIAAGALTATLPLVGMAYRGITGATTGAGEYVVGRAMDKSTPELIAAMRGEITEADVLANTRQAVANVAQKRSADYLAKLNQLNLTTRVNLNPTLQTMDHMLGQLRVNQVLNPQTGKMELDFAQSHLMLDAAAQQKIRSIFDTVAGYQWNDVRSVDALKRAIDGEYAGSGQASAFVQAVKSELRDSLDKTVPGYQSMTKGYAEASDFMNNLTELSTGNKNDGVAIRKLAGALKQNNNYRKDLLEALDAYTNKDLVGQIAGSRLSSYSPRGIMGALGAAGGMEHLFQNPITHFISGGVLLGLFGMSPRAVGEAAVNSSILSRLTKAAGSYLPSAFGGNQQPDRGKSVLDQNFAAPPSKPPDYGKSVFDHYDDGGEVDSDSNDDADSDSDSGSNDSVLQNITRRILGTQDDLSYGDKYLRPVAASRITQTPIWQMDTEYHQWPEGKIGEYEPIFDRINVRPETLQNNPNEVIPHESTHALYENGVLDPGLVLRHDAPPEVLQQILSLPGVYPPLPDNANRAQIRVNQNMNANERLAYSIGLPGATPFIEKVANSILDPKVAERLRRLHYNALMTRSYNRGRAQPPDAHAQGGKIRYDDGGDVDSDSNEDDILRDIVRRGVIQRGMIQLGKNPGQFWQQPIQVDPEQSKQRLFGDYQAPPRPMMGPPQDPSQAPHAYNMPEDTSYSQAMSQANPMPEWMQKASTAISQPGGMPLAGPTGAATSFGDSYGAGSENVIGGLSGLSQATGPRDVASGLTGIASGLMEGAAPSMAAGLQSPQAVLDLAVKLGSGVLTEESVKAAAKHFGMPEEYANLLGMSAGLGAAHMTPGAAETLETARRAPGAIQDLINDSLNYAGGDPERGSARLWVPGRTKLEDINKQDYVVPAAGKRLKKEDIMQYMQRQVQQHFGAMDPDAPPRAKLQRLLRLGRRELDDQLSQPKPNLDFYLVDTPQANADMVQMFPELKTDPAKMTLLNAASAALAQGSNPGAEAMNGGRAYGYWRQNGRLPEVQPDDGIPGQRPGKQWSTTGGSLPIIKLNQYLDMFKSPQDPSGIVGLQRVLTGRYPVGYLRQFNENIAGRAGDLVSGAMILGPKIGSYFLDISSIPQAGATVDMWDTLAHHRRMGYMFTPGGKAITTPQKLTDRQIFQDFHRILEGEFGLDRTQSQSGLWHYEKDLYRRLGVPSITKGRSDGTQRLLDAWGHQRQNVITRQNAPPLPDIKTWIAPQVP